MWNQPYQNMGWHEGWLWWGPLHGLISLLLIAAIVIGVVYLVRALFPPSHRTGANHSSALSALNERYAKGEINREEYLQKKADIIGS